MPQFDYQKICLELLKGLPSRTQEVISRRFGLEGEGQPATTLPSGHISRETLQTIGQDFDITRERVRQIEFSGISKLRPFLKKYQRVFQYFIENFKKYGDLKKEDVLLTDLGDGKWQNQIYFLLTLGENFEKFQETVEFYSLWTINRKSLISAKSIIDSYFHWFEEIGEPKTLEELKSKKTLPLTEKALESYLGISKKIQKNEEGFYGLKDWPEISPRGVKDKAFLVLKKIKKPLHFNQIAQFIAGSSLQTVHNELIRDPRFVLIGRGIYALKEWGYLEGDVKDVILKILQEAQGPMTKEELLRKVLEQRQVKENTVFLNLSNKQYFLKDSQGRYILRENV